MLKLKDISIEQSPYPHIVLKEALEAYEGLESDFPSEDQFSEMIRSHGDLTYPDPEYLRLLDESHAYKALHDWVYSPDFIETFLSVFNEEIDASLASGDLLMDPRSLPIKPAPYENEI